ncbi:MAG: sensor histidine kinase [Mangrovibacterium sp.]
MKRQKYALLEQVIYLLIWAILLLIPFFSSREEDIEMWVLMAEHLRWLSLFMLLFVLNNFVGIPLFLKRKKIGFYCMTVLLLLLGVFVWRHANKPHDDEFHRHNDENIMPLSRHLKDDKPPFATFYSPQENDAKPPHAPAIGFKEHDSLWFGPHINDLIFALLIIGFNIAIYLLFKSIRDEEQIKELKNQTLRAELDYLKAQINPHFFMNTLNNIHALVDIDGEQAKLAIIELSKIMRYVLYDANHPLVPLSKEMVFLENYIALMRIRYADSLEIITACPKELPSVSIPPLLLITLIENAFKHGVGIRKRAFIHAHLSVVGKNLIYEVENSLSHDTIELSGVGLDNLRKRLSLLFKENYRLTITPEAEKYTVELIIPIEV